MLARIKKNPRCAYRIQIAAHLTLYCSSLSSTLIHILRSLFLLLLLPSLIRSSVGIFSRFPTPLVGRMSTIRRLFRVIAVVAVCYLANGSAYPTNNDVGWVEEGQNRSAIEVRAPPVPGAIVVPLYQEAGHTTWTGYQVVPGLFGASVSDEAVRETAKKTYNSIESNLPWSMKTALVAVVYVPRGGWAAGTVWHGSDTAFQNYAQSSTSFWGSVQGQGVLAGANNEHAWHAEAVAVANAEKQFGIQIRGGDWPRGTKIFTYGKTNGDKAGPKAICVPGHTSVAVSCGEWLDHLGIQVVALR